ncbi:MAG TPA: hypothetical protein VIH72_05875 [Candidatus Acidoferrales bacterium]|jgi:hypothetical protein
MAAAKTAKINPQEKTKQFDAVYSRLSEMLLKHKDRLSVAIEKPGEFWMAVTGATYRGKPLVFAGVRMGKNYVSYHLMSVYMRKVEMSPELKKRLQGKACFNFSTVDEKLFGELDTLTALGLKDYRPEVLEKESKWYKKK